MKKLLMICILLISNIINAQVNYKKDNIYIFARSTKSKVNFIAEDFNLNDKFITHIGIGYYENDTIKIYNVSNDVKNKNNSALLVDNYKTFINVNDVISVSIWSLKVNKKKMKTFIKNIKSFENLKIEFDNNFILNDDNILYCSEFVYNVLNMTDDKKFHFKPISKRLNQFYSNVLKRLELVYIPVDFYQSLNFKKVFEFNKF